MYSVELGVSLHLNDTGSEELKWIALNTPPQP